jgi:alginate O-acetyltransferase complex protein AlgI
MLFNSYHFIFGFLPIVCFVFALLQRWNSARAALHWLTLASIAFYSWWYPPYLALLLFSATVNFYTGRQIALSHHAARRRWLIAGITFNLGLLGVFKYTALTVRSINALTGSDFIIPEIALPLAISFYTFTQITYLVDVQNSGKADENFLHYLLFLTFFPHLIAGPIIHYRDIMPQFSLVRSAQERQHDILVGLSFFIFGLSKKVLLADSVAPYASRGFEAAASGRILSIAEAWGAAMAYTMQIYFDFSGYSDMAIGLALLFGIRMPINFFSPYKSTSIIDFWRRWHITLSRFLREYLYIPLGGNRHGPTRRYVNLIATMGLGGLWHGAEWTFVIWGLLHGGYLIINHAWRAVQQMLWSGLRHVTAMLAWPMTFLSVVVAWVFFRATSLDAALSILRSMSGQNGISLPLSTKPALERLGLMDMLPVSFTGMFPNNSFGSPLVGGATILALLALALLVPNTSQIMQYFHGYASQGEAPVSQRLAWKPTLHWALLSGVLAATCVISLRRISEFIYFNF